MKWIKATPDRLPKVSAPAKRNGRYGTLYNNGSFIQFLERGAADSYSINSRNIGSIEWLDESASERFVMPTDEQLISAAIIFNDGKMEIDKITNLVAMCELVVKRLYENGDMTIAAKDENNNLKKV